MSGSAGPGSPALYKSLNTLFPHDYEVIYLVQGGDPKVKLERSRQSARECRARKKLRSVQKTSMYGTATKNSIT